MKIWISGLCYLGFELSVVVFFIRDIGILEFNLKREWISRLVLFGIGINICISFFNGFICVFEF